ncbi:helix-turn-helix domain-containing protein [Micromonospora sp. DT53]|uniref:helix-turn-helix domain-containing protein n=1 Tax=Micromonospora sp. DT53 TaxID=3393444 RepID=UPI003CFA4E44
MLPQRGERGGSEAAVRSFLRRGIESCALQTTTSGRSCTMQFGSFGFRLREHRHAAGLTMEQLAEVSGVSARAISDMERERSLVPQRRTVQALAEALVLSEADRRTFITVARTGRARAVPAGGCSLPRPIADFTGRVQELERLGQISAAAQQASVGAQAVTVSGVAGVGKTTLAVQAAHVFGAKFVGGIFFLDLRGMDARPTSSAEALARLLAAFGVRDGVIPVHESDRAGMYRRLLAGRPALVVLDNGADEAQVRPLLPEPGRSLTVITSRRLLAGLEGAHRLNLTPLPAEDAAALLRRILGDDGPASQSPAVGTLSDLCGRLPLALRIAGNRLTSRPEWTVQHLASLLSDERRRLDQLVAGDLRIAAAFNLSYTQLSPPARRLFRRLSLLPGPDFDARRAAALDGNDLDDTEVALEELIELSLLRAETDGRYGFHNLIRLFARQRLVDEEPTVGHDGAPRRRVDRLLDGGTVTGRRSGLEPAGLRAQRKAAVG